VSIELENIEDVEAWSSSVILSPNRWHNVRVESAEETRSTKADVPQVEIRFSNQEGDIREWLTVTREAMGRVRSFLDAVELPYKNGDAFPTEAIHDRKLSIFVGQRQIEDGYGGFKMRSEVKAFAPLSANKVDPTKPDESGFGPQGNSTTGEDIPF